MAFEIIDRWVYRLGHAGMVGSAAFLFTMFGESVGWALVLALAPFGLKEAADLADGGTARNTIADLVDVAIWPALWLATVAPVAGVVACGVWVAWWEATWRDGGA
jgi:hypothetical protein